MAKPTGFMEYDRELPPDRSPLERIKDWNEFHEHFTVEKLQTQGARCMGLWHPILSYRDGDCRKRVPLHRAVQSTI